MSTNSGTIRLGLRENLGQFSLQVVAVLTLLSSLHVASRMRETHSAASRQNVAAVSQVVD